MSNAKKLAEKLSPLERKVLPHLREKISASQIVTSSGLSDVEVVRALQWLSNKKLVKLKKKQKKLVVLTKLGNAYEKTDLPERRLLRKLTQLKAIRFEDAEKRIGLTKQELTAAIGLLKGRLFVAIDNNRIILKASSDEIEKPTLEESFLDSLPLEEDLLMPEQKLAFEELRKRNIITIETKKDFFAELTELGRNLQQQKPKSGLIEQLTSNMLTTGKWKNKRFRRYDVAINVPTISGGKRQPYYTFLQEVREELVKLGFVEMQGPTVESEFWNYDALFQPQFHVARDWADTYYVKDVKHKLPPTRLVSAVGKQHEKSWNYTWKKNKAALPILRPQGTSLSARMLASQPSIPGKYFAIARCYRPDVVDAKHLTEFNQVEGIVLDEKVTFQNLLGILKQFAEVIADSNQVEFIPDYYPFTEPSVQLNIKHKKLGWIEIGGAGIFREELTRPLGIKVPVLAWGLGIDRLAMCRLNIHDIRQLFSQDLDWLRETKL